MRLLNIFVILLLAGLLAAGGYFAYKRNQSNLVVIAGKSHESLVNGLENSVWKTHRHKISPILAAQAANPTVSLTDDLDVMTFLSDVSAYLNGIDVLSVHIYSPTQQLLVAFTIGEEAKTLRVDPQLLTNAANGKIKSGVGIVSQKGSFLAQTAVPLLKDNNLELLIVVTSSMNIFDNEFIALLGIMVCGVAISALIAVILMSVNMRRAENVIAKQYEENADLVTQASAAKEQSQQKSQFLANISHELRTPLNAIIGFSDILRNEFAPAPGQAQHVNYINDIHSAGTHLLSLINDILDYSKAEAGKLELEVTEVNAAKMIQNCTRLLQPRAETAQVQITESLPKEQAIIVTDGKKFKQVLLNLLSNAVKFTPAKGTVKVSMWLNMQDDCWMFEVRDTGIGIAPKDISRAMSPFGQVDNALSRKFEGTGLGLPLTKKFVELMGGKFSIDSELNKGTTVTFSLPRELKPSDGIIVKQVA